MKNNFLKIIPTRNDLEQIDYDLFCESLLVSIPQIENICKHIDSAVRHMCTTNIPNNYPIYQALGYSVDSYSSASEYANAVVEEINYKRDLLVVHHLFMQWYGNLKDKNKNLYLRNFVRNEHYQESRIPAMVQSFVKYLLIFSDVTMRDLMTNPYLYKIYKEEVINKKKKGEKKHDCSTNEGSHS